MPRETNKSSQTSNKKCKIGRVQWYLPGAGGGEWRWGDIGQKTQSCSYTGQINLKMNVAT